MILYVKRILIGCNECISSDLQHLYIFWTLVTGPVLVAGWRESPAHGLAFLGGFYATIVGGLALIVLVFGLAARFGAGIKRNMLGVSALALLVFGLYQLSKAFA